MNPKEKIKFISNWIKSYAEGMPSKAQSLVIGISGGRVGSHFKMYTYIKW